MRRNFFRVGVLVWCELLLSLPSRDSSALEIDKPVTDTVPTEHLQQLSLMDRPLLSVKYPQQSVDAVAFSPNGRLLATACAHCVQLIDLQNGQVVHADDDRLAHTMVFAPDGNSLILGAHGVQVLRLPSLAIKRVLPIEKHSVDAVAVSRDSRLVAVCAPDGSAKLCDIATATVLKTFGNKEDRIKAVAFSPDGKLLATLSTGARCEVRELPAGNILATAETHYESEGSLRFSSDSRRLAMLPCGSEMYIWDFRVEQPTPLKPPEVLIGKPRINGIGFDPDQVRPMNAPLEDFIWGPSVISPDLRTVASVLENGRLAIWDVIQRRVVGILPIDHEEHLFGGGICDLVFSDDGELLAIGTRNGVAEVWRIRGDQAPVPGEQPFTIDRLPGPWGATAIAGLRTRLVLEAVEPADSTRQEGKIPHDRRLPLRDEVWWRVGLQVRNETDQNLTVVWPKIRRAGGLNITLADKPIAYESLQGDALVTRKIPIEIQAHDISTMNSILLGRNHDLSRPGKYRLQFQESTAEAPLPAEVTNPILPASNVLEFVTEASSGPPEARE